MEDTAHQDNTDVNLFIDQVILIVHTYFCHLFYRVVSMHQHHHLFSLFYMLSCFIQVFVRSVWVTDVIVHVWKSLYNKEIEYLFDELYVQIIFIYICYSD